MLYQFDDTVSWTKGPHSFKFGVNIFAPMRNILPGRSRARGATCILPVYFRVLAIPPASGITQMDYSALHTIRS